MKVLNYQRLLKNLVSLLTEKIGDMCIISIVYDAIEILPKKSLLYGFVISQVVSFATLYNFSFYVTTSDDLPLIRLYR